MSLVEERLQAFYSSFAAETAFIQYSKKEWARKCGKLPVSLVLEKERDHDTCNIHTAFAKNGIHNSLVHNRARVPDLSQCPPLQSGSYWRYYCIILQGPQGAQALQSLIDQLQCIMSAATKDQNCWRDKSAVSTRCTCMTVAFYVTKFTRSQ